MDLKRWNSESHVLVQNHMVWHGGTHALVRSIFDCHNNPVCTNTFIQITEIYEVNFGDDLYRYKKLIGYINIYIITDQIKEDT